MVLRNRFNNTIPDKYEIPGSPRRLMRRMKESITIPRKKKSIVLLLALPSLVLFSQIIIKSSTITNGNNYDSTNVKNAKMLEDILNLGDQEELGGHTEEDSLNSGDPKELGGEKEEDSLMTRDEPIMPVSLRYE